MSPPLPGALGQLESLSFHFDGLYHPQGRVNFLAIKYVWEENSPRQPSGDAGSPRPRPGPVRGPPTPPATTPPRCCCLEPRRAWWPQIRPLIALGDRHPADRPRAYRSSHRPGREESSAGRGSRAGLCPALPASSAGPIVSAIWPAKAALLPSPPPLPRLKLINGSAYRLRHRLHALSAGTSISARNKRRTEARAAAPRFW